MSLERQGRRTPVLYDWHLVDEVEEVLHVDVGQVLPWKEDLGHLFDLTTNHPSCEVSLHEQLLPQRVHFIVAGSRKPLDLLLHRPEKGSCIRQNDSLRFDERLLICRVYFIEAFIIALFKWLPNCLFNVIWSILFWEIENSVLSAKKTSSMK